MKKNKGESKGLKWVIRLLFVGIAGAVLAIIAINPPFLQELQDGYAEKLETQKLEQEYAQWQNDGQIDQDKKSGQIDDVQGALMTMQIFGCNNGTAFGSFGLAELSYEDFYSNTGIENQEYVSNAAIANGCDTDDIISFAALVEATEEEHVELLVSQMKKNIDPSQWDSDLTLWDKYTVEDFTFYTNGRYIFVAYVSDYMIETQMNNSPKEMIRIFEKILAMEQEKNN